MKIEWSAEAVAELRSRFGDGARQWRLVYDTEGCGCAVNGVPALWAVETPEPEDLAADGGPLTLWHSRFHEIFFDASLRIAYDAGARRFSLAGNGEIYTNRLAVSDRRSSAAAGGNPIY